MKTNTRKLTTIAMFCAIAFVLVLPPFKIPFNGFLDLEVKDTVITIGAFLMGPLTGLVISVIVPTIEMLTVSHTGPIGLLMNILSTATFVCTASFIYKKKHNMKGAVIGLTVAVVAMTIVMLLWNYIITPAYMKIPREAVVEMLVPILLPFNLIKAAANMALTILLYKPIVNSLRKAKLVPEISGEVKSGKLNFGFMIFAFILLATSTLLLLIFKGII